ncbi:MAG: sigma-70 family RNA polymerase sigma factor [Clostridiales bacterium]|nr:sigma-70 family RNA polymerase sigma factor [Clostridiales bacterium]
MNEEYTVITKAANGDLAAFEELMRNYERLVYSIAYGMFHNDEDAKDLHQEAWIKIYVNMGKCKDARRFKSWVCKVATNVCIDEMRRRKGKRTESLENANVYAERQSPENAAIINEEIDGLKRALCSLSPEERALVTLRGVQGFSYAEIARVMGMAVGTVKSGLSRARGKIIRLRAAEREA